MGERGDQLCPLPHVPRLLRPNGVRKPPPEDVRTALGRKESVPGPGRRSGGPSTCADVLSRAWVGRLFSAKGRHVVRRRRAAGPQLGARANRLPPSDFKNFAKTARPTEAGSQLLARQDKKLTELLDLLSASKPNQLRGLLSE